MLIDGSGWGTVFCCFLRPLHDSLAMESDCSGNYGADKLFWDIKNLSSCRFLVAIDSFHIVTSLSNRSSIEKSIKSFLQMKGQIAY